MMEPPFPTTENAIKQLRESHLLPHEAPQTLIGDDIADNAPAINAAIAEGRFIDGDQRPVHRLSPKLDTTIRRCEALREAVVTFLEEYDKRAIDDDNRIQELTGIIRAILAADERGQGVGYAEAMAIAAKVVGWES